MIPVDRPAPSPVLYPPSPVRAPVHSSMKTAARRFEDLDGPSKKRIRGKRDTVLAKAASGRDYDGSVFRCILPTRSLRMNHCEKVVRYFWDVFNHHDLSMVGEAAKSYFVADGPFDGCFKFAQSAHAGKFNPLGVYDDVRLNHVEDLCLLTGSLFEYIPDICTLVEDCQVKKSSEGVVVRVDFTLVGTVVVTVPVSRLLLPLVDHIDQSRPRGRDVRLMQAALNCAALYDSPLRSASSISIEPTPANRFAQVPGGELDSVLGEFLPRLCCSTSDDAWQPADNYLEPDLTDLDTDDSEFSAGSVCSNESFEPSLGGEALVVCSGGVLQSFGVDPASPLRQKHYNSVELRTLQVPVRLRGVNTCKLVGEEGHEKIATFNTLYRDSRGPRVGAGLR